jgi:hypothetical protein
MFKLITLATILAVGPIPFNPQIRTVVSGGGGGGTLTVNSEMASATGATATAASLTYSFSNTAGTFLLVGVVLGDPGRTVSSVTYGGVAMTLVDSQITHDGVTGGRVYIYKLSSPLTGANNVVVTPDASTIIMSGAISFTGENATPLGTPFKAAGNSGTITVNVTGTASSSIIVDVAGSGVFFSGQTGTLSWERNVSNSTYSGNGSSQRSPGNGGTVTMSHTATGDGWAIIAVEVKD